MRDDPDVIDLVERARRGEKAAWDGIVERFAPLLWSVCRRYGLSRVDAEDVCGGVWLRLVEHLDEIREPAALAGWLARTTDRECQRLVRVGGRERLVEEDREDTRTPAVDEWLLRSERTDALRTALGALPDRCRELLIMLFGDPPVPYAEIETKLGMKHGTIGPTRIRCLDRLRRSPPLARLIERQTAATGPGR